MFKIRPACENCNKALPFDAEDAMICTFECTFCKNCTETILQHICPNCGGNFEKRPIRPKHLLQKYPVSDKIVFKPVDLHKHQELVNRIKNNT